MRRGGIVGWAPAAVCAFVFAAAAGAAEPAAGAGARETLELEPVTVYGTTPLPGLGLELDRVPANVQQMDSEDVGALAPLGVPELLRRRGAGVHLTQTQNNPWQPDVVFRGFSSSFLLGTPQGLSVFQDGVRLNDFLGDAMSWDLVPEGALASLEIVPGANPIYGRNTLGGALALQTKSGRTHPGTVLETSGGSFGRVDVSLEHGDTHGPFDWFLAGDFSREDGFRDHSDGEVGRLFGRAGWRGEATEASLTYNLARNELRGNGFVPESLLAEDRSAVFTHPDVYEPALDFLTAHLSHALGPALRLDARAYLRRIDAEQFNADAAEEEGEEGGAEEEEEEDEDEAEGGALDAPGVINETTIDQRRAGGLAQATWLAAGVFGENALTAGVEGEWAEADVRLTERDGRLNASRTVVDAGPRELASDVETAGTALGLYATDSWTPLDRLTLTASVRYDRATVDIDNRIDPAAGGDHVFDRVNPAFGANVRLVDGFDVYARYGESFRTPSAIELACANEDDPCPLPVAFADDPPLEEVRARTWETGLRARPLDAVRASLAFFRTELRDDILFVASSRAAGFFQNVGETRRVGLESTLEGSFGFADVFAGYSLTRATFETTAPFPSAAEDNVAEPGDELPGVPNHLFRAGGDLRLPWSLRLGADLQYASGAFLRGDESNRLGRLDGFAVVNARLSWTWRAVTLFARAENLLDEEYETFGAIGENPLAGERVERFLSAGAPLGGWFGVRVEL